MYSQTQGEISPTQLDTMTRELLMKNISTLKAKAESMRKELSRCNNLLKQAEADLAAMDVEKEKLKQQTRELKNVEAGFTHIENGTRSGEQTGNDRVSDAFEIIKEENLSAEGRVYRRKKKVIEEDKLEKVEKDYLKACRQLKVL